MPLDTTDAKSLNLKWTDAILVGHMLVLLLIEKCMKIKNCIIIILLKFKFIHVKIINVIYIHNS